MNLPDLVLLAALGAVLLLAWRQQRWRRPVRWLWLPACAALWCLAHPPSWPFARSVEKFLPAEWRSASQTTLRAGMQSATENALASEALRDWQQWRDAAQPRLVGAGMPEIFWQYAEARAFDWQAPDMHWIDAPARIQLGDAWILRLRHTDAPTAVTARQLRVRDRAGAIVAETRKTDENATAVSTAEPVPNAAANAEAATPEATTPERPSEEQLQLTLVPRRAGLQMYRAEWLDASGQVLGEQILPLEVEAPQMLGISGEFSAPSFEQRALREWLNAAGMDWRFHSRTGRDAQRQEQRQETSLPQQLRIVDARRWLDADARERALWLSDTANGNGLIITADGSENDAAQRQRLQQTLGMDVHGAEWQAADTELVVLTEEGRLTLTRGSWQPVAAEPAALPNGSATNASATEASATSTTASASESARTERAHAIAATNAEVAAADLPAWLRARVWSRAEGKGRIAWWPLADSHRFWQRAPAVYARSWQMLFAQVLPPQPPAPFFTPDAHWRVDRAARVCARERPAPDAWQLGSVSGSVSGSAGSVQILSNWQWQLVQQAWCATFWPRASGWLQLQPRNADEQSAGQTSVQSARQSGNHPTTEAVAAFSVYGREDSVTREAADNANATAFAQAAFAHARVDAPLPLPRWLFLLVFLMMIATIWWVERRWPQA